MPKIQINVSGETAEWLDRLADHSGWTLDEVVAEVLRCAQGADAQALLIQDSFPVANTDLDVEYLAEAEPTRFDPDYMPSKVISRRGLAKLPVVYP